uniref:CSON005499 protein n=1 Tax=Culicoides sonorensis TaxID=179676 RepID=A0A336MRZ4_CULSO
MEETQCRICLKYLLCAFSLKDEVRQTSIWEALNEIAKVFVSVEDSLPQSLCWTCYENLEQALQFKEQVENSDNFLHSKDFERIKIEDDHIEDPTSSKNQSEITIKQEIGHEINKMKPKSKSRRISRRKPKVEEAKDQDFKELELKIEPTIEMVVTENSVKISPKKKKLKKENINEFYCCICREAYKSETDLLNHVQLLHLKQIEVNQSIKYTSLHILECNYCKLRFRLRKSLKQHLEDPFFVEPFRKPSSKKRYKVPVVCTICGKILQGKHELKRHEFRLHATEFPFSCPHPGCEKRFAAQSMLKIHLPSHGPKTHVCDIDVPYMRPPLSKEMWFNEDPTVSDKLRFKQWNGAERSLYYEPQDFYLDPKVLNEQQNGGVSVCRGYQVVKLDISSHTATLDDGTQIKYGKCLIATGARPRNLDVFEKASPAVQQKISFYKSVADFKNLRKIVDKSGSIAVVGGGFLGSELSVALAHYGKNKKLNVHQLFYEKGNMGKILPEYLSKWTTDRVKEEGVNVMASTEIKSAEVQDKKLKLELNDGRTLLVDHAIVAVGSEPNTELAKSSGLEVDKTHGGFVVNAELEARHDVFVAGDVSCFYDIKLGRRRVEHHDHAVVSGRLAGENMVGLHKPFNHQSMFWSDLGPKVGYEAIGIIDSSLPTTGVFAKETSEDTPEHANMDEKLQAPHDAKITKTESKSSDNKTIVAHSASPHHAEDDFGKGVVFYLNENDRVVGILLWNVFNRIGIARKIINQDTKYDDLNEVAKLFDLFDIHEEKN